MKIVNNTMVKFDVSGVEVTTSVKDLRIIIAPYGMFVSFSYGDWAQRARLTPEKAADILTYLWGISGNDASVANKIYMEKGQLKAELGTPGRYLTIFLDPESHHFTSGNLGSVSLKPLWDMFEQLYVNYRSTP